MKNIDEARQIQDTIASIHAEITRNRNKLEKGIAEIEKIIPDIPNKEKSVFFLKNRLKQIREKSIEYKSKVNQEISERNQYNEQTKQLIELTNFFNETNSMFENNINEVSLPQEVKNEINQKLDQLFMSLSAEYTKSSIDYAHELKKLTKLGQMLDREINTLSLFDNKKSYNYDDFDIFLEEYSERYLPSKHKDFNLFNNLKLEPDNIKNPIFNIKPIEMPHINPLNVDDIQTNIISFIKSYHQKNSESKKMYKRQSEYLDNLLNVFKNKNETYNEKASIENRMQRQYHQMIEFDNIFPINIPNNESSSKPLQDVIKGFENFCSEVKQIKEHKDDFIPDSKFNFEIPQIGDKNSFHEQKYVKRYIPSRELINFANDLSKITESTKQMIPIQAIQILTSTHRSFISQIQTYEPPILRKNIEFPPIKAVESKFDMSAIEKFKDSFKQKFPVFSQDIEKIDIEKLKLEIPKFEVENSHEELLEDSSSADSNINLENRIEATNTLLRTLINTNISPIPKVVLPDPIVDNAPKLLDTDSYGLKERISHFLSPNYQKACIINNEITTLNNKIENIGREMEDQSLNFFDNSSLSQLSKENSELYLQLSTYKNSYQKVLEQIERMNNEKEKIVQDNQEYEHAISQFNITNEMINEKEKEYKQKQNDLETRKQNWKEELELRKELNGL